MPSRTRNPADWMLSDALAALADAERMHRQIFQSPRCDGPAPCWEPPVDVLETEREVLVLVALPGVDPARVEAAVENGELVVRGRRVLPPELQRAVIHRLELPQGRFERRIPLPPGRYALRSAAGYGCLVFTLEKLAQAGTP
jgi:HSP20 family molecular chaperone IbpA